MTTVPLILNEHPNRVPGLLTIYAKIAGITLHSCHICWQNPTLAGFTWSDFNLTNWFASMGRLKLRTDGQFFNLFNNPNFGLSVLG